MAATTSKDQDALILVGVATLLAVLFVTINAERKKKFTYFKNTSRFDKILLLIIVLIIIILSVLGLIKVFS
jgi:heme/copper-type cytochrome/quinol oxidase subunit 2